MLSDVFPMWDKLTPDEQALLTRSATTKNIPKGTLLTAGSSECLGFLFVQEGHLRAYITSEDGKEITLYRLLAHDVCLFSASCLMKNIRFDVCLEAVADSLITIIPSNVYERLMNSSIVIANYTNDLMGSRFSDVMWLMEQVMWQSFDRRLAAFLLEERALEESDTLRITHEQTAKHLGSAREVVTRMLKHFQTEGLLTLSRGTICLTDVKGLLALSDSGVSH